MTYAAAPAVQTVAAPVTYAQAPVYETFVQPQMTYVEAPVYETFVQTPMTYAAAPMVQAPAAPMATMAPSNTPLPSQSVIQPKAGSNMIRRPSHGRPASYYEPAADKKKKVAKAT